MTFYEQVGIVIPGAILLFGLMMYFPELQAILAKDGVSLGQFGIYLLLSYASGHMVAALGNALESVLWKLFGGMPTDWITREKTSLLSNAQIVQLEQKIQTRLGITGLKISGLDRKQWWPISRQLYADVATNGKPDRIDTFNGNYGLNRGLAAATFALACVSFVVSQSRYGVGLLLLALIFAYRAYRFGVHYGREMYLQFLVLK
jgi:hypothetical protein